MALSDSSLLPSRSLRSAATLAVLSLLTATLVFAQSKEPAVRLADHTPMKVLDGSAVLAGHYDPKQMLRLAVAVQPPHMAEEEQFLEELTDRRSPSFHRFLTAEEWDARFAPSAEDEQRIVDWAESQGLTVTARFPSRLTVDLEGRAGTIEKAFGVTINQYKVGEEIDFSNDRDPALPSSLAPLITAVLGLNNIEHMEGSMLGSTVTRGPDYASGPVYEQGEPIQMDGDGSRAGARADTIEPNFTNGNLDPTDIYSSPAYDYAALQGLGHCCNPKHVAGGSPPEASIAIAAYGNINSADILGFHSQYPYLAGAITPIKVDGGVANCTKPGCYNYSDESTFDVEWAMATANSFGSYNDTAHVYIYIAPNDGPPYIYDLYNRVLHDKLTRVVSTSWGCTEIYGCSKVMMTAAHSIFNAMVGQGWTLLAGAGDRGATEDCQNISLHFPAVDPDFIAIGGTYLDLHANGSFNFENAWQGGTGTGSCKVNDGGTGGGVSQAYNKPSYQVHQHGKMRILPDIAMNAAYPQNYYFQGALSGVGGTSMDGPMMAGFFAQENAYLLAIGDRCGSGGLSACAPVGAVNPFIYLEGYYKNAPHYPFYDILTGCNSNDVTAAKNLPFYCAGPGYDEVTGWGTSNMLQLAWMLNWDIATPNGYPSIVFSGPPTGTGITYHTSQTVSWKVLDSPGSAPFGTGIAGYTAGWDSIPADPTVEPNGGTGNSFYSGPATVNKTTGCLSLVNGAGGCAGGVPSGCHYVVVEAWNNQGMSTGKQSYGPICWHAAGGQKPTLP